MSQTRRGGLGRGLAALIPTGPTEGPRLGAAAADVVFGAESPVIGPPSPDSDESTQNTEADAATDDPDTVEDTTDDTAGRADEAAGPGKGTAVDKAADRSDDPDTAGTKNAGSGTKSAASDGSDSDRSTPAAGAPAANSSAELSEDRGRSPAQRDRRGHSGERARPEPAREGIGAEYREVPLEQIEPNPKQPRQVFDEESLAELVHSIRE